MLSSLNKSHAFFYEVVHIGRSKASGINRTRLINTKFELDTAHPTTHPATTHIGPTINDPRIQEVQSDTNDDGNVERSTTKHNDYKVANC